MTPDLSSRQSERGFTLVEMMLATTITLVIVGVAFSTFKDALALNETATQMADASLNLRAGTNLLVRDLMQTGRDLPIGGIAIPSGNGSSAIHRPGPPGRVYTFNNTTATAIPSIVTGSALGPTVAGRATDLITILMDDPFLAELSVSPSTASGSVAKLAANGASFDVGSNTAWLAGNPAESIAAITPGDLIYFSTASGNTLQTVTRVSGSVVYFDANDPFNFNQRGAAAGSITQILGATMSVRRVLMFTYFVYEETPGVPRLMRSLNQFAPQALVGIIEDLEFSYDLVDGVINPTAIESLPYTANGVTYSANQVRKVNIQVSVRSEAKSPRTKDYLRNHLSTTVSLRNLAYVDRYQ